MKRGLFLWGPVLLWAGFIFFLSSIPDLSSGLEQDFLLRKIAHVAEYAVLALLLWRALGAETCRRKRCRNRNRPRFVSSLRA